MLLNSSFIHIAECLKEDTLNAKKSPHILATLYAKDVLQTFVLKNFIAYHVSTIQFKYGTVWIA